MPNYTAIYKGRIDVQRPFPFSTIEIPHYASTQTCSKFSSFLLNRVDSVDPRLTCDQEIAALVAGQDSLCIDTDRCIACLACLCSHRNPVRLVCSDLHDIMTAIIPGFGQMQIDNMRHGPFNGHLKRVPTRETMSLRIRSFDQYTAQREVEHIALWTTIMLRFLASDTDVAVGKEIPITNPIYPRDNRLDTCCASQDLILIGETKNSLESLLQENRYRTQVPSYQAICDEMVSNHNALYGQSKKAMVLLVIGGRESDLLPPSHPHCTSIVGERSHRFYDDIMTYSIRFVSASLLWTMAVYTIAAGKRLCWDLLFPQVFSNPDVVGILSGGQVAMQRDRVDMSKINPNTLESSVISLS